MKLREAQLRIRRSEIADLMDEVFQPDFLQTSLLFGAKVRLDLDKLIIGGHSFGGLSSILAAREDPRIKAVFTFDPWVWAIR